MAQILTSHSLSFCYLKDIYHVEINPDSIVINCDEKGVSKETKEINISYGIYCGSARVSGTATFDLMIDGSQITAIITNCSETEDGSVQFTIPANVDMTSIDAAHIIFSELNDEDNITFTLNKYIQFIKVLDGTSGAGLIFKVYSEDGTAFREYMTQITLETIIYIGDDFVDTTNDIKYIWGYWDNSISDWNDTLGTSSTLTVQKTDNWAFKTIRCAMTYNGNTYYDYISLTNDVIIYDANIKYFNGSNVFKNTDKYLIAYVALYKNGEEIDLLQTSQYAEATSVDDSGAITTTVTGTFEVNQLLYFIVPNSTYANLYDIILGKYDGTSWNQVDMVQEYTYENLKASDVTLLSFNTSPKIFIISKSEVNKTMAISFNIYDANNFLIATAQGNVVDLNDPIVSGIPPENPVRGQLWIDTSSQPYVIKVYTMDADGNGQWVNSTQQYGGVLYTYKPSSYSVNDIWILNEGEYCIYTDDDGVNYNYGPGSMLRATQSSTTFNASDWVEVTSEITQMRDNIAQYFEFDSETGLKIGRKDEKFYVNISATEMGFYDNSNPDDPNKKVVMISNQAATIRNAVMQDSATFDCDSTFNSQMHIKDSDSGGHFVWKIESNGSLSLVISA